MRCDRCGEHEASVHEVLIDQSGAKLERHLCERCAAEAAQAGHGGPAGTSPAAALQGMVLGLASDAMDAMQKETERAQRGQRGPGPVCKSCGTTFAKFRQSGLLGCPACYASFGDALGRLIERAHEGGVCHVGKTPKRAGVAGRLGQSSATDGEEMKSTTQQTRMALLRRQLDAAVRGEQYERAAALKLEIERLSDAFENSSESGEYDAGDEGADHSGGGGA